MGTPLGTIAIGQYIPVDSVIHRLDPRTKLAGMFALLGAIFLTTSRPQVLANVVGMLVLAALCKVGWRIWVAGLRRVAWLVLIGAGTNVLFHAEGKPVIAFGFELPFTVEGLIRGIVLSVQILLAMAVSMTFTFSTTPAHVVSGLDRCCRAIGVSGAWAADLGLLLYLAMRFVPILQQEAETLVEAQKARGVDFHAGGLVRRSRHLVAVLGPALTGAFRRGDILATAMVARGFRTGMHRSHYRPLGFSRGDLVALICLSGYLLLLFVLRR